MNALASDQARRFAEVIHDTPAFDGLRVGLFIGQGSEEPGSGLTMTAHSVITDHGILRKAPPDILLTNYKMLDYLLIRPRDRALWVLNTPETLRYVVVDELHTFDGAQARTWPCCCGGCKPGLARLNIISSSLAHRLRWAAPWTLPR